MLIYEPKGKAREYSPYALNLYTGCEHQCSYCYVKKIAFGKLSGPIAIPRKNVLQLLEKEINKKLPKEQILLSFTGDPFCKAETKHHITRQALKILCYAGAKISILTKGGYRALEAIEEIKAFGKNIKIGATLTFLNEQKSLEYEPGAALPKERIEMLSIFKKEGINTWASFEPVIDTDESLSIMRVSMPFVDQYKVGKLNYVKNNTDWGKFLYNTYSLLKGNNKPFYIKYDLQVFEKVAGIKLSENEKDMNFLCLK